MPPDHVHFNGSVNLADAESVMREIASRVPSGLRRLPDGETGDRGNWIFFQLQKFLQFPWLVPAQPLDSAEGDYEQLPQLRLADGVDLAEVSWPDLGYADAYLASYQTFVALREQGVIPPGVRFQVEYPTPLASISGYIAPEQQQALLGSYERAMFADLDRLVSEIPHGEMAVQWDVAVESGILEEASAPGGAQAFDVIITALARCIDQVPAEIPAGLHLCYGDRTTRPSRRRAPPRRRCGSSMQPWRPARPAAVTGVSAPNAGWAARAGTRSSAAGSAPPDRRSRIAPLRTHIGPQQLRLAARSARRTSRER